MKKPKGKKGGGRGTGKIRAHMPLPGMGKDPHASSEHHAANKACDMPEGMGCSEKEYGNNVQGENEEMC
jgi:hypothetical protein